jgi:hypothetical protein
MKFLSTFASINDTQKKNCKHVLKFMIFGWQVLTFISPNLFSFTEFKKI